MHTTGVFYSTHAEILRGRDSFPKSVSPSVLLARIPILAVLSNADFENESYKSAGFGNINLVYLTARLNKQQFRHSDLIAVKFIYQ